MCTNDFYVTGEKFLWRKIPLEKNSSNDSVPAVSKTL
jgi:hypothetical protein